MADIGEIRSRITLNTKNFETGMSRARKDTRKLRGEADRTQRSFRGMEDALGALGSTAAFAGMVTGIRAVVREASSMHMALQGLVEVSKALGYNVDNVTDKAQQLASKGFMSVAEASESLKLGLSSGLNLEETTKLINAFSDSAAYNRQSTYEWGEAVKVAMRGVKQGNSELTDAAGLTRNLSQVYEDYSEQIGVSVNTLTDQQKAQAAVNGFTKDAALFAGNAESAMDSYQGEVSKFSTTIRTLKSEVGEGFLPVIQQTLEEITPMIVNISKWSDSNEKLVATLGTATVTATGMVTALSLLTVGLKAVRIAAIGASAALGPAGLITAGLAIIIPSLLSANSAMASLSDKMDDNFGKTQNLTREYDALSRKLEGLEKDTAEAVQTKERMAQITETLRDISPQLVQAYDAERESVNNLTDALVVNTRKQMENLKAKLADRKAQLAEMKAQPEENSRRKRQAQSGYIKGEGMNVEDLEQQVKNLEDSYTKLIYDQYDDQRMAADAVLNRVKTDTSIDGANYDDVDTSTSASGASSSSSSSNDRPKTVSEIAHAQYQKERRQLRHKRAMDKLTLEDEKAKLEKLRATYSKYADIRMELDEEIHRVQKEQSSQSFEQSVEAIEKEERTMLENGKTSVEVAEMKEDAYSRLAEKYADNAEYMKQVEQNLHTTRMTLLREEQREQSETIDELNRMRSDFIDGQKEKLSDLKDAELESITERKQAELDALDERRKGIEDHYDEQLDQIDGEERAEERKKLQEQIETYRYSTSKKGQEHLAELKEKMRQMDRDEERRQLREEKEDKLDALDEEERNIESHYNEMRDAIRNYNGDREALFADTNANILDGIRTFVDQYNAELSRMKKTQASTPSDDAPNSPGKDGIYYKGEHYDTKDFDKKDFDADDMLITRDGKTYTYSEYANAVTYGEIPEGKFHTGGVVGQSNFASGEGLMPNEVRSVLEQGEVVMTPRQIESLIGGKGQSAGPTNYYYGPLIGHDGDVKLEDEADVSTYWREREIAAQRLMSGGDR